MRRLSKTEIAVATSLILVIASCLFAAIMAKIMENVFFAMYSDRKHHLITEIFLHANQWSFFVPLLLGIPMVISWQKNRMERDGSFLMITAHLLSVIVLVVVALGIMMPLLTTNFGMGK